MQSGAIRQTSAYPETGHAFMAFYVGARIRSVTIEDDDWENLLGPWMR